MRTLIAFLLSILSVAAANTTNLYVGQTLSVGQQLTTVPSAGGGGGGPTLIASDNFDGYANAHVLSTSGDTAWAVVNDSVSVFNPTGTAGAVYGANQAAARRTGTFNANQRSISTISVITPGGSFEFVSVAVRCATDGSDTRYWFQTDSVNWYLCRRVSGSQTVIVNSTHAATLIAGDKISLDANGTGSATRLTVRIYHGGAWSNLTGADTIDPGGPYIDGGTPGIGGDSGSSATATLDNWEGWNL